MKALLLMLVLASPAAGQDRFAVTAAYLERHDFSWSQSSDRYMLSSETGRTIADVSSWVIVSAEAVPYAIRTWKKPDHDERLCAAARLALTAGSVQGLKRLADRERPDHSDRLSWPSGHSAYAALMTPDLGWKSSKGSWWYLAIPVSVMAGRVLAGKHDLLDVLTGAGIGFGWRAIPCS